MMNVCVAEVGRGYAQFPTYNRTYHYYYTYTHSIFPHARIYLVTSTIHVGISSALEDVCSL